MQTNKFIVVDTCALFPNCKDKEDKGFDINKWIAFLNGNKEFGLSITPFTLYEILENNNEKNRNELLNYLISQHFDVLSYRKFPYLQTEQEILDSIKWLPHLKQLIVYECNRMMENMAIDFILREKIADISAPCFALILKDINDLKDLNQKACREKDLKKWFGGDYFTSFFSRVTETLAKNCNFHSSTEELMKHCIVNGATKKKVFPYFKITKEDWFLSAKILEKVNGKSKKYEMINYVIDALNLHSVFQKGLGAYFITRDKEAIELFEDAQKYGIFVGKEKSGFLKSFLI